MVNHPAKAMEVAMAYKRKKGSKIEPSAKLFTHKLLSLGVKVVDRSVPDTVLRFYMNLLDKRIPPKVISTVVDGVDHVPDKLVSSVIIAADEYVPDTVANSRKVCAVLAGLGKYIPDRVIPPESAERWDNIKLKFHIPTLIVRKPERGATEP